MTTLPTPKHVHRTMDKESLEVRRQKKGLEEVDFTFHVLMQVPLQGVWNQMMF